MLTNASTRAAQVEQAEPIVLMDMGAGFQGPAVKVGSEPTARKAVLNAPWHAALERLGLQLPQGVVRVGLVEKFSTSE